MKKITKGDLRAGDFIETRSYDVFVLVNGGVMINEIRHRRLGWYNDELRDMFDSDYDIIRVYRPNPNNISSHTFQYRWDGELIYDRSDEIVEMTISEIEEKLGIMNLKIVGEKE